LTQALRLNQIYDSDYIFIDLISNLTTRFPLSDIADEILTSLSCCCSIWGTFLLARFRRPCPANQSYHQSSVFKKLFLASGL